MSFHEVMAVGILLGFVLAAVGGTMRFLTGNVPHPDYPEGGGSQFSRLLSHEWGHRGVVISMLGFLLAIISIVAFFVVD